MHRAGHGVERLPLGQLGERRVQGRVRHLDAGADRCGVPHRLLDGLRPAQPAAGAPREIAVLLLQRQKALQIDLHADLNAFADRRDVGLIQLFRRWRAPLRSD